MRTIPEIVAELKQLLSELEQHTGVPAKKEAVTPAPTYHSDDTIVFNFDNMNMAAAQPVFSYYENSGDTISISAVDSDTITLGPLKN